MAGSDERSAAVWRLVRRQHGVIARDQLRSLGYSVREIEHRLEARRMHPVYRAVYAVGRPEVSRLGRWMAAVLACGPHAALSHASAAALWGIRPYRHGPIAVSVLGPSPKRVAGIRVHRRTGIGERDIRKLHGIPVTDPICTLIDIAPRLTRDEREAAVNDADRLDLVDPETLRRALKEIPPRRGTGVLRETLDRRTFTFTRSELERRFLRISHEAGLTRPLTNVRLNGFEVDFYFADIRLVVETDGLRYHRTPAQQARDRLRDQAHTAAGLTQLRFTHAQVRYAPGHVRATLRAVAATR